MWQALWKDNKSAISVISLVSLLALAFLTWLIYLQQAPDIHLEKLYLLPSFNAGFNSLSTLCIICGILSIKRGYVRRHIVLMISAFVFSTLFLISYIVYHSLVGDTIFTGIGIIRPIYFLILISHIVLTAIALPMILMTFYLAFTKQFNKHRFIARFTYPIWLYVSVTGVLIYIFLRVV